MNITLLYIRNGGVTMRIIKNIDIGIFLNIMNIGTGYSRQISYGFFLMTGFL